MKVLGGTGAAITFGVGTSAADQDGRGNGNDDDGGGGRGSGYTPYRGKDTKTAPDLGTFDEVLMYLAEVINPLEFESLRANDDRFGVEGDPLFAKFWHFDIQQRTVDEIIAYRQAHHDYAFEHFGIDMQGKYYSEARTVPPATFAPPLGQVARRRGRPSRMRGRTSTPAIRSPRTASPRRTCSTRSCGGPTPAGSRRTPSFRKRRSCSDPRSGTPTT